MEKVKAMNNGIYILANDKTFDNASALLNSIRLYDSDVCVVLIPYDNKYQRIKRILTEKYGVGIYKDLEFLKHLDKKITEIFGKRFFDKLNKLYKLACWFGQLDKFLYIDTDVIVFEKIIDNLKYLTENDFLCCDYQYKRGISDIFTPGVLENGVFTKEDMEYVFNSGFWASKKEIFSERELNNVLQECAQHSEYFDFSQKVSDMPIINYLVLKLSKKKFNIVRDTGEKGPGSWAGMPHFIRDGNQLIDPHVNKPLKYLHWAGIKIKPGCPYYDVWKYYRDLKEY